MAGVVNETTRDRAVSILREIFPGARVRVEPDYTAAFFACPAETDVCVISGTGSLVCSQDPESKLICRSGGGGYLIGDEGSAFQFGRDAVKQFLDSPLDASESLSAAIQQLFGTVVPGDIIAEIYRMPAPATILAKLAKSLVADYRAHEPYAVASVHFQMDGLARVARKHIERFELKSRGLLNLCLAGGLWKGAGELQTVFEQKLRDVDPSLTFVITRIEKPPIHGALTLAHRMVNPQPF
jgi:N-acetylglucosamine kinase-like BadF-type ATPase